MTAVVFPALTAVVSASCGVEYVTVFQASSVRFRADLSLWLLVDVGGCEPILHLLLPKHVAVHYSQPIPTQLGSVCYQSAFLRSAD